MRSSRRVDLLYLVSVSSFLGQLVRYWASKSYTRTGSEASDAIKLDVLGGLIATEMGCPRNFRFRPASDRRAHIAGAPKAAIRRHFNLNFIGETDDKSPRFVIRTLGSLTAFTVSPVSPAGTSHLWPHRKSVHRRLPCAELTSPHTTRCRITPILTLVRTQEAVAIAS
jgi:hypothetical protein